MGHRASLAYLDFTYRSGLPVFSTYGCFWDQEGYWQFDRGSMGQQTHTPGELTGQRGSGWVDDLDKGTRCYALCAPFVTE